MNSFFSTLLLQIPEKGNFISISVIWLMEVCSSVVVGILLFTLILKIISFPFDLYSRIATKKNSIKMEEMRGELEKLQKQYANNKALYNQKMSALYKKNGYSMLGSCLSMIVTIVIFIFAINGFNSASAYENRNYYYNMSQAYNEVIYKGFDLDDTYIVYNKDASQEIDGKKYADDKISVNDNLILSKATISQYKAYINTTNYIIIDTNCVLDYDYLKVISDFGVTYKIKDSENVLLAEIDVDGRTVLNNAYFINKPVDEEKKAIITLDNGKTLTLRKDVEGSENYYTVNGDNLTCLVHYNGTTPSERSVKINVPIEFSTTSGDVNATLTFGKMVGGDIVDCYFTLTYPDFTATMTINNDNTYTLSDYNYKLQKSVIAEKNYKINFGNNKIIGYFYTLETENAYVLYKRNYTLNKETGVKTFGSKEYSIIEEKLVNSPLACEENDFLKVNGESFVIGGTVSGYDFVKSICRNRAKISFDNAEKGFWWVKNIWGKDSPLEKMVNKDVKTLSAAKDGCSCNGTVEYMSQSDYDELTYNLTVEKDLPNGFFILPILTALLSLVMQIVTMKTQKAQLELQSVNGQGATTQKMMTWMMPIMMAIFSFMYPASFSVYMIVSTAISVGTMFLTNWIIDKKYKSAKNAQSEVVRGRVYTPPQKTKEEIEKEKLIAKQKASGKDKDFIKGDKTEIKGKLQK